MKPLNVVVIGTGMYTCGRGTEGYGTVMPAIMEWAKTNRIGDVYVAGASGKGVNSAKKKMNELRQILGAKIDIRYFPQQAGNNPDAYRSAIRSISRPAACIVAVPDDMHRAVAGAVIEARLHTLVVKPLARTLKEARELIALQDRHGVYCAVEFHKRFDLANIKLRDIIAEGRIGDPLYFVVEYSQRKSVPSTHFKKWAARTNIFQYLGVHYVDIIYFATKATPRRISASGQKNWLVSKGIDTYDSIQAAIEWEMPSGKRFISHILTNWIDPECTSAMSDQKIKVIGTDGRFESDQKRRGITIVTDDKGMEEPNPYFCCAYGPAGEAEYRGYGIDSIHRFLDDVVDIETGKVGLKDLEAKRPTFRQSLASTAVLEAANKSLRRKGEWISAKDV